MSELLETIKLIKLGADWSDFALKKIDDVEKAVKALKIIIEKNVDIALLKECKNKTEYNIEVQCHNENLMKPLEWWTRGQLTEEEFDTVKEVFADD